MRLIDADALEDRLHYRVRLYHDEDVQLCVTANQIDITPTIDAVPVVRCRECKWSDWYVAPNGNKYCHCMETEAYGRTETDYCSYGEREDGDA